MVVRTRKNKTNDSNELSMISPFIGIDEVANLLDVASCTAAKIIKKLNGELKQSGKLTISGKTQRKYFYSKIYKGDEYLPDEKIFIDKTDLVEYTGLSKSFLYKKINEANKKLEQNGYIVMQGKLSKKYFEQEMLYND